MIPILLVSWIFFGQFFQGSTVTINTTLGQITGVQTSVSGQPVFIFKRIPFAKPPVGSRRFRKPEEYGRWNGVLQATAYGPQCYHSGHGSEDCLYLNIYIPRELTPGSKRSVMVWIHGGAFAAGTASEYDGSRLAVHGDVIVVTTNYRLEAFGFLSTGDANSPGNYGLWDQHFAIKWVKDHIYDFGGNPGSITVFGESAGGVSVGLQTISPYSDGLFQRAISESGNGMFPLSKDSGAGFAIKIGSNLGCSVQSISSTQDSQKLINCLVKKSSAEISSAWADAMKSPDYGTMIVQRLTSPVVDGDFIPDIPEHMMNNHSTKSFQVFSNLDIMAGTNDADGVVMFGKLYPILSASHYNILQGLSQSVLCNLVAPSFARDYFGNNVQVKDAICNFYTVHGNVEHQSLQVINVYGDVMYTMPTLKTLAYHARGNNANKTFQYLFTQKPVHAKHPWWIKGAFHAEELAFVWGFSSISTRLELQLSNIMMTYWTNFAKTGDPNGGGLKYWPPYDDTQRKYMELNFHYGVQQNLYPDRRQFWFDKVSKLIPNHMNSAQVIG